jgi:hypothetical protein
MDSSYDHWCHKCGPLACTFIKLDNGDYVYVGSTKPGNPPLGISPPKSDALTWHDFKHSHPNECACGSLERCAHTIRMTVDIPRVPYHIEWMEILADNYNNCKHQITCLNCDSELIVTPKDVTRLGKSNYEIRCPCCRGKFDMVIVDNRFERLSAIQ